MDLIRKDYGRARRTMALELNKEVVRKINLELSNYVYVGSKDETVSVNLEEVENIAKYLTHRTKDIDEDVVATYTLKIYCKADLINMDHPVYSYLGDIVKELLDDYLFEIYDYSYDFDSDISDYWIE